VYLCLLFKEVELNPFAEYIIPYKGLKDGIHRFDYRIGDSFFSYFAESVIRNGDIFIEVELEKRPQFLIFRFNLKGNILSECDLCLEELSIPVDYFEEVIIKFGEVIEDFQIAGEDKPVLTEQDYEINIAHQIFELIHLNIPLKKVHPDNEHGKPTCNPEMLKEIDKYLIHENSIREIDPRWEKLIGLQSALKN
jgi:uncharacterized metal-binding protein YceD (DUF177 family)